MALDFPSNPTNGQVYDNFIYDSTKGTWKSLSSGASPSILTSPTITDAVISATAPNSTTVPLRVNGAISQSASLQEWMDSAGTSLASVSATGSIISNGTVVANGGGNNSLHIKPGSADHAYISYFPRTSSPNTRSAYVGFASGGTNTFTIGNEFSNSSIVLNSTYVGMPNQPAFYSQGSGTITLSGAQQDYLIPFTTAELNRGNCFNTSNYRFTAPIAGVYYFWMQSCTTDATSTGPEIYIVKNGSAINNVAISYNSAYYNTFGGGYFINLNANDYVQMAVRNNNATTFTLERGRSRFAGYLIG